MTATETLKVRLEEPGDDPLCDETLDILCKTLPPAHDLSLELAAQQVASLLPEGRTYSNEFCRFLTTCYEVAEQISYTHLSMIKLVSVIDSCLNSSRFPQVSGTETDPIWRYQKLGETLRDWWDTNQAKIQPNSSTSKPSQLDSISVACWKGPISLWLPKDALETSKGATEEERNAYVRAASQWLLIQGDEIYSEVTKGKVKPETWQRWYERLNAVADAKADTKVYAYDQSTVQLARQASVAMDAMKRRKAV